MKKTLGFLLGLMLTGASPAMAQDHPLDPLTQEELTTMVSVLKADGRLPEGSLYPIAVLNEPPKAWVKSWKEGEPFPREAFVVALDRKANKTYEAVVDVKGRKVVSWKGVPDVQPGVLIEEFATPRELVRNDPQVKAALKKRGIEDVENVQVDTWASGLLNTEERATGARLLRCLLYYRPPGHFNPHHRPIEGIVVVVDLAKNKVVRVDDSGVVPVRPTNKHGELTEEAQPSLRPTRAGMRCAFPEGNGYKIEGHEITWENWKLRFGMHPREGLVLYDVRYNDKGVERPIMYRGSLSEMVVPYGDPDPNWSWRNAFDLGEYGVGRLSNTLRPGLDGPNYMTTVDSVFADDFGKPYVQKDSVAIYEREHGLLWKHFDFDTGHDETRRARWLYLTYIATVGNYDYALSWVLGQDGTIAIDCQLTGILLPKGVAAKRNDGVISGSGIEKYGRLVESQVVTPNHEHFFNFRLDMDVDGVNNSLYEINNHAAPMGPENPLGNAFIEDVTQLKTEGQARRRMELTTARSWIVASADKTNAVGDPTGYMLMPGENAYPYLDENAPVRKRAGFINAHVWGTKYAEGQMNGAGYYPNQSLADTGLSVWSNNESLDKDDVVLWYTMGVCHNPRPEEWPVMSSHHTGFKLAPNGFFDENPTMDVPASVPDAPAEEGDEKAP
jgi:primary-amine oxidase